MRILIIDDEPKCVDIASASLQRHFPGFQLDSAVHCAAGCKLLSENTYDAVVIDHRLVGESGIDCMQFIRSRWRNLPIVMVTGGPVEFAREAFSAGADDFVSKEAADELLGHAVWAAIERRRRDLVVQDEIQNRQSQLDAIRTKLRESKEN